jgi:hypothetical protein
MGASLWYELDEPRVRRVVGQEGVLGNNEKSTTPVRAFDPSAAEKCQILAKGVRARLLTCYGSSAAQPQSLRVLSVGFLTSRRSSGRSGRIGKMLVRGGVGPIVTEPDGAKSAQF